MKIGLFIPCYMDLFYPEAAMATLKLLESHGLEVDYPSRPTCCGQPMANSGCVDAAMPVAEQYIQTFAPYEYIVCPSGSCTSMVRNHYDGLVKDSDVAKHVRSHTYELCEFLVDVLKVDQIDASFPFKVGIHQSCHGLRELRLGSASEIMQAEYSKVRQLLEMVRDIEIVELTRPDECCGFGGAFSVNEEAVSCMMGQDRIADHEQAGAQVMVSVDMSCLMHMHGLIERENKPMKVMHVAEVLVGQGGAV